MNFQDLEHIETADKYIDIALHAAEKHAELMRTKSKTQNKLGKSKFIEIEKITIINKVLTAHLNKILESFPSIDNLPIFYQELIKCTLDYPMLKKSLGAVNWASMKITDMIEKITVKLKMANDQQILYTARKQYYGRVCSFVKQIKENLEYLEHARRTMKDFPAVKTSLPTICIAGFPNVGKSTLLARLTPAKPEIKNYAFTTKSLNFGYITIGVKKIQVVDTPGTLNRFEKMNNIEKQAYLAMQHCADIIVYVFDLTEQYPLEKQEQLFQVVINLDKPTYIYLSKTDILPPEKVKAFHKKGFVVYTSKDELEKDLIKKVMENKELAKRSYD
ncbi:50S ribosome-binding GTPase [Candidatus Woesearchaeota archaeon]|nr:50S ribosome-binding GTPase [Candidatus Woesearchaeota archaeon]